MPRVMLMGFWMPYDFGPNPCTGRVEVRSALELFDLLMDCRRLMAESGRRWYRIVIWAETPELDSTGERRLANCASLHHTTGEDVIDQWMAERVWPLVVAQWEGQRHGP